MKAPPIRAVALAAALLAGGPLAAQEPSAFTATYGDWTVRCAVASDDRRFCAMEQRFLWRDADSGQDMPLMTVTLAPAGDTLEATAVTPFGLLLEAGLTLRTDERQPVLLAFRTCLPEGCVAIGTLASETVAGLRAGRVLHVEAEPAAGGEPFRIEGSLLGFTAAHDRLLQEAG